MICCLELFLCSGYSPKMGKGSSKPRTPGGKEGSPIFVGKVIVIISFHCDLFITRINKVAAFRGPFALVGGSTPLGTESVTRAWEFQC